MKLRTGFLATIACAIVLFGSSLAAQILAPAENPALTPAGESDPIATAQSIYHEAMQIEERDALQRDIKRQRTLASGELMQSSNEMHDVVARFKLA